MGLIRRSVARERGVLYRGRRAQSEGLRAPDECCRHKALDLIGDLALLGRPLLGHVIAERAGHAMPPALVARIMSDASLYEVATFDDWLRGWSRRWFRSVPDESRSRSSIAESRAGGRAGADAEHHAVVASAGRYEWKVCQFRGSHCEWRLITLLTGVQEARLRASLGHYPNLHSVDWRELLLEFFISHNVTAVYPNCSRGESARRTRIHLRKRAWRRNGNIRRRWGAEGGASQSHLAT